MYGSNLKGIPTRDPTANPAMVQPDRHSNNHTGSTWAEAVTRGVADSKLSVLPGEAMNSARVESSPSLFGQL